MQVTQQADLLTHAVINAGEQLGFGVSDDPMFFQMLYSSLYGNPIRAAIREPLCNAWDANIDNGKRDVPLEITLTETSLTIKDSGKGIPHDKIQQTYLILGKSTKVQQSDQTGGFGLGCKAPFAYAEHFEVRSSVDGVCTIYRLIKVSPEHGGRPAATVIASFPTKETGLTVTIPFVIHGTNSDGKPYSNDYRKIKGYLLEAIAQGGILANVNGVLVPTIPLDHTPGSWVLGESMGLRTSNGDRVFVRYGSVVYPVRGLEGLRYYREVEEALRNNISNYGAEIVFQAPPDSIVIPPNRESISQHEKTVETLENLFLPFLQSLAKSEKKIPKQEFVNVLKNIDENTTFTMRHMMDASIKSYMTASSLTINNGRDLRDGIVITDTDDIVRVGIGKRDAPFRKNNITLLIRKITTSMAKRGFISFDMAKKLNHHDAIRSSYYRDREAWATEFLVRPLVKRLMRYDLKPKNLYVYNKHYEPSYKEFLRPWDNHSLRSAEILKRAARKILIMSYSKIAVFNHHMTQTGSLTNDDGGYNGAFVYLCPKGKGAADQARALFSKMRDYTFIDHTMIQDMENEEIRQKKNKDAAQRRAKIAADKAAGIEPPAEVEREDEGFASLLNALDGDRGLNFRQYRATGEHRVMKPLFYLEKPTCARRSRACRLDQFSIGPWDSQALVRQYGGLGFIPTTAKHRKYVEDNQLPNFAEFIVRQMERAFHHSDKIQLKHGLYLNNVRKALTGTKLGNLAHYKVALYDLLLSDQWLCNKLGVKLPPETQHMTKNVNLLEVMINSRYFIGDHSTRLKAIKERIETPIIQQATRDLFVLVRKNQSGQFVNFEVLAKRLHHRDKGVRMAARKYIIQILNIK